MYIFELDKQDLSGAEAQGGSKKPLRQRKKIKKARLLPLQGKSTGMGFEHVEVAFGLLEPKLRKSEVAELQKSLLLPTRKSNFWGLELFFSQWSISQRN